MKVLSAIVLTLVLSPVSAFAEHGAPGSSSSVLRLRTEAQELNNAVSYSYLGDVSHLVETSG